VLSDEVFNPRADERAEWVLKMICMSPQLP
jgi:hypothetical protein